MTIKILNPYAMQNHIDAMNIRTVLSHAAREEMTTREERRRQPTELIERKGKRDGIWPFNNLISVRNCAHN